MYTLLMKRIRVYYYLLTIALCFFSTKTVLAEDITISTYYPAPYGNYQELETTGDTSLATTSGNIGIGTTAATALANGNKLQVSGAGNVEFNNTGDALFTPSGNIGIGTALPAAKLHMSIQGDVRLDNTGNVWISPGGNIGIGPAAVNNVLQSPSPNGNTTGNLTVVDMFVRSADSGTGRWASTFGGGALVCDKISVAVAPGPGPNTWGSHDPATCNGDGTANGLPLGVSGYARTGCSASCAGIFNETDLKPTANNGCTLGPNDTCNSSGVATIKVYAVCCKVQ